VTGRHRSAVHDTDLDALRPWIGRRESRTDVMDLKTARALAATLGHAPTCVSDGDELPPAWHWVYFTEAVPPQRLGSDGHALRGGFLPPIELPRRLWAGGRLRFHAPLHIGDSARRDSTVAAIEGKTGRSGRLVFVSLRHEIHVNGKLAIEEEQDLVYRAASRGRPASPRPPPGQAQWSRALQPDPVLLFRYSALTFNSHRIHYDRPYALHEEGYPALVVQGPLTATLLLDLLLRQMPHAHVESFSFRGLRPLFDNEPMQLQGYCDDRDVRLWALDGQEMPAMDARARLFRL